MPGHRDPRTFDRNRTPIRFYTIMEAVSVPILRPERGKLIPLPLPIKPRESLQDKISATGKLVLPTLKGFECVPLGEILFLQAQGNYTEVHTLRRKYLFSKTLKAIEDMLPSKFFYRAHRSYVVNVTFIRTYNFGYGEAHFVLSNDTYIPVSKTGRKMIQCH